MIYKVLSNKKSPKQALLIAGLYVLFLLFLLTTNPKKLGVGWLLLPFVGIFSLIFLTVRFSLGLGQPSGKSTKKKTALAAITATCPTIILILASIDQLTAVDSMLIVALSLFGIFYTSRLSFNK